MGEKSDFENLRSVWLEGLKSGKVKNREKIEKFLVFSYDIWFESKKVEK